MTHDTEQACVQAYKKICIIGAGAIGLWLGARLGGVSGVQLSVLARGNTLAALQTNGIVLHSGDTTLKRAVNASNNTHDLGEQDLIIICVKGPALLSVAQQIAPLLGKHTVVLSAMNGVPWWFMQGLAKPYSNHPLISVDATGHISKRILATQVVGSVIHASCTTTSAGVGLHRAGNGIVLGEAMGAAGQECKSDNISVTPRLLALHGLFVQAGFDATVSPRIQQDIWYKLWGNMTMNPISALTGATMDVILADNLLRGYATRIMLEAQAIGEKLGLPIAQDPQARHEITAKLGAVKTSMLQDVEANRSIELDALVTAVRELGLITQTPTPNMDGLLGLVRVFGRQRGIYPT